MSDIGQYQQTLDMIKTLRARGYSVQQIAEGADVPMQWVYEFCRDGVNATAFERGDLLHAFCKHEIRRKRK